MSSLYNDASRFKTAVAIGSEKGEGSAPVVLAKGKGPVADRILGAAQEHNIPIQQDPALVELLGQLDVNEAIPEELFDAVAEIFAFIYQLDRKMDGNKTKEP